jgi:hypothetical protein
MPVMCSAFPARPVVAHPVEDDAERPIAEPHVCLVDYLKFAAPVGFDPQEL